MNDWNCCINCLDLSPEELLEKLKDDYEDQQDTDMKIFAEMLASNIIREVEWGNSNLSCFFSSSF